MKPRTGDDEESGKLKLGTHAFSDDTTGEGVAGGFSKALGRMRSFGRLVLSEASARQSLPAGGSYHAGRGRGPRGPIP